MSSNLTNWYQPRVIRKNLARKAKSKYIILITLVTFKILSHLNLVAQQMYFLNPLKSWINNSWEAGNFTRTWTSSNPDLNCSRGKIQEMMIRSNLKSNSFYQEIKNRFKENYKSKHGFGKKNKAIDYSISTKDIVYLISQIKLELNRR